MKNKIPTPSVERLSLLCTILDGFEKEGTDYVSSSELGGIMGVPPNTLRKDINFFGQPGGEFGYKVSILKETIEAGLGLNISRRACIVGLGELGSAILNFSGFLGSNIKIEAGFDSSINRLETFVTDIPLFPAHRIAEVVKSKNIVLGVLAVPPSAAQLTADRLIEGGIKGILNLAPVVIKSSNTDIPIRNFHVLEEFRILSALYNMTSDSE